MNRVCLALIAVPLILDQAALCQSAPAEPATLRGESAQTRKRLAEADQKVQAGQAADALDELQRVLDEAGDELVSLDGKQFRSARWIAHQILARVPADVLKGYQDRIEEPARKLLEAGKRNRDVGSLWQLLDRYFTSRPADEGLLLLGDLLFERGECRTAEQLWRRLLPDADADVVYPGTKAEHAAVRARLILAAIFLGETERAEVELAKFSTKYPDSKGSLAGKEGSYLETLRTFLASPPKLPAAANPGVDWPMFGGAADRSSRVGTRIPTHWSGKPTWSESLPVDPDRERLGAPERPPFGQPVVLNGRVYVTDGVRLCVFDLVKGKSLTRLTPARPTPFDRRGALDPSPAIMADGNRLYMRLGPGFLRPPLPNEGNKPGEDTAIVCLGSDDNGGDGAAWRELWRVKPPLGEPKTPTAWEGAPLVAGRRLWAAYVRFEGGRSVHGIACYDPADSSERPAAPVWTVDVCESPLSPSTEVRTRQELLTLAGRNVVLATNTGGIVALNAVTGKRAWAFRYPRSRKGDTLRSADPAPAICVAGRVFVAPADGERVYALDAETGSLLWESGSVEGAQLLGVSGDKLIVTVTGPVRSIRALNIRNGSHRRPEGWVQHDNGGLLGYGRGFVTDDVIVWPTRSGLFFLRPQDGLPLRPPFYNPLGPTQPNFFGNVVYADGVLIVVTPTQIWGYVSDGKRFPGLGERSQRDPTRERFEHLINTAEAALASDDHGTAALCLQLASSPEFPRPLRAWAVARYLLISPRLDPLSLARSPHLWLVLHSDLWNEWVFTPEGPPATLKQLCLGRTCQAVADPDHTEASVRIVPPPATAAELPALGPGVGILHTLRAGAAVPLPWLGMASPTRVFLVRGSELLAVPIHGGEPQRYESCDRITAVGELPDGFVAVGPLVVAVYGRHRTPAWVFRVPTTDPLPGSPGEFRMSVDEPETSPELSSVRLLGDSLVARLGDRHLIALDLKNRRVAWVLSTNRENRYWATHYDASARFGHEFTIAGRLVVVQLTDGRRWLVRLDNGRVLDVPGIGEETALTPWVSPPAFLAGNRLVISDGPGRVRLFNLMSGRMRWTHELEGESSLSGDPPQVRAWGEAVFLAVRRNHGVELDRIDPTDGKSFWSGYVAFLDANSVDLAKADLDGEHLFVPAESTLTAIHLKSGTIAWETELPQLHGAGNWVARIGQRCIMVYPTEAIPREPVATVVARLVRSFRQEPALWRLPSLIFGLYDAWVARTVPVLLFAPLTGELLARVDIPAAGPAIASWFDGDCCVVATGGRVVWLR